MAGPLVVLDGSNLARRQYHATGNGGAVVSAARRARDLTPGARIVVAWDSSPPGWRHALWPDYKAHRQADPDAQQFVRDEALRSKQAAVAGFWSPTNEADDVAATLVAGHDGQAAFVTSDKDWCQLLDYGARWFAPENGGGLLERDAAWVWERFGVVPSAWPDFVALAGDASDGIPGVRGIGPVRAAAILRDHGSAAAWALGRAGAQDVDTFRRLAELRTDAPIRAL